jgi:uncharacterized membrane protein
MSESNLALFFHLLGAFSLIAGTAIAGVAFETARRRTALAEIALLLGLARIGVALVAVGTLLVVAFGLWLVELGHWGYSSGWVLAALVLLASTVVLGAVGGQRPKRARKLAGRVRDEPTERVEDLRALLDDRVTRAVNGLAALLLLAITALMVFKPGA